ncbi:hypothetical protein ILYODFUR_017685 [Ilyodon furcidens]|uniref:Uncharacterized protein n=1 Tax=Ilyodon furcidens TaxID=33524 RepID=A0ABV0TZN9_9TELE
MLQLMSPMEVNQTPQCPLQCQLYFPFSHQLHLLLQPSLRVLQTLQLLSPLGFSKILQHSFSLEVSRMPQHQSLLEISQTSQHQFQPSQTMDEPPPSRDPEFRERFMDEPPPSRVPEF